jgi:hypothetical protein
MWILPIKILPGVAIEAEVGRLGKEEFIQIALVRLVAEVAHACGHRLVDECAVKQVSAVTFETEIRDVGTQELFRILRMGVVA